MNKYQEALNEIKNFDDVKLKDLPDRVQLIAKGKFYKNIDALQELVDRATPVGLDSREEYLEHQMFTINSCHICGADVNYLDQYCPFCGQALETENGQL